MSLTKTSYSMLTGAPVNVLDNGAGSAAEIQAAIDAGSEIVVPVGTYSIASVLNVSAEKMFCGQSKQSTIIHQTTNAARGLTLAGALRSVISDMTLQPPTTPTELAIYADKSQEITLERLIIQGWDGGIQFLGTGGTVNVDWFNNIVTMEQVSSGGSLTKPNLDWQGINLNACNCDFSSLPPSGIRAAVRIRAGSYDSTFENTYYEHGQGAAGGNVFQCEGGVTLIKGGFAEGGQSASQRIGNYISASGGAIVIVEGITGYNYWASLVTADGAGTVVYVMPGCFSSAGFDVTTRFVETSGGKVIDLSGATVGVNIQGITTNVTFSAGDFTGDGTINWNVGAGDVLAHNFTILGKQMTVNWYLQATSTSGSASGVLNIAIPAGKTAAKRTTGTFVYDNNGGVGSGTCDVLASGTNIRLLRDISGSNWNNTSTNATSVAGQFTFEIN